MGFGDKIFATGVVVLGAAFILLATVGIPSPGWGWPEECALWVVRLAVVWVIGGFLRTVWRARQ